MSFIYDYYEQRVFPRVLDAVMRGMGELRDEALAGAHGDVLEIGFGTGLNLLATLIAWDGPGRLHYTSFEAFPMDATVSASRCTMCSAARRRCSSTKSGPAGNTRRSGALVTRRPVSISTGLLRTERTAPTRWCWSNEPYDARAGDRPHTTDSGISDGGGVASRSGADDVYAPGYGRHRHRRRRNVWKRLG